MPDFTQGVSEYGFTFHKIKSNKKSRYVLSILLIASGTLLIIFPGIGAEIFALILGALLLALGIGIIFADAFKHLKNVSAYALPAVCIVTGVLLIIFRVFIASIMLPAIIGVWALCFGISNLRSALKVKAHGGYWKSQLALAAILIVLGVSVLVTMVLGGNAIGVLIGAAFIAFGAPLMKNKN